MSSPHPSAPDCGGLVTVTGVGGSDVWLVLLFVFWQELRLSVFSGVFVDNSASLEPAGCELSSLANDSWVKALLLIEAENKMIRS